MKEKENFWEKIRYQKNNKQLDEEITSLAGNNKILCHLLIYYWKDTL